MFCEWKLLEMMLSTAGGAPVVLSGLPLSALQACSPLQQHTEGRCPDCGGPMVLLSIKYLRDNYLCGRF